MNITAPQIEDRISELLKGLASTDEAYGKLKAEMIGYKEYLKIVLNQQIAASTETSIAAATSKAYQSPAYVKAVDEYKNCIADYETLNAKRATSTMKFEAYRSMYSARKQGVMQ